MTTMFEHPILNAIRRDGFLPLGWFAPEPEDGVPPLADGGAAEFIILVGNAGPSMFSRFSRERKSAAHSLDEWCRQVIGGLAAQLDAKAVFPFDKPALPFLRWAKRGGQSHQSPLGLTIHADFGLWHAYRAALIFAAVFDIPPIKSKSPCEACAEKPCLSACPVNAFDGAAYDVDSCVDHIASPHGGDCMAGGCLARRACPVGRAYVYEPAQMQFHMNAFRNSRLAARAVSG
jgi:hypothetical protein